MAGRRATIGEQQIRRDWRTLGREDVPFTIDAQERLMPKWQTLQQLYIEGLLGDLVFYEEHDFNPQDDLTGKPLDPGLTIGANREDTTEMYRRQVWLEKYVADCCRNIGKPPIPVRWVKTNKGDDLHPNVRCRLVATHLAAKYGGKDMEDPICCHASVRNGEGPSRAFGSASGSHEEDPKVDVYRRLESAVVCPS